MPQVYRKEIIPGLIYKAPKNVTFNFQTQRKAWSIWYNSSDPETEDYMILVTGEEIRRPFEIVETLISPDGFMAVHLVRLIG